jgi:hypothetical protein
MVSLLAWTGTSLSVSFYVLMMATITFISVYLITETYEGEMTEDIAEEEGAPRAGKRPGNRSGTRALWSRYTSAPAPDQGRLCSVKAAT